jgi:hypothetical protein
LQSQLTRVWGDHVQRQSKYTVTPIMTHSDDEHITHGI